LNAFECGSLQVGLHCMYVSVQLSLRAQSSVAVIRDRPQGPGGRGGASGSARDPGTPGPALGIEGPAQKSKNHRSLLSTGSQRSKSSKSLIQESRGHRSTRFQKSEVRGQSHVGLQDCFKGLEVTGTEVQESTAHSGRAALCRAGLWFADSTHPTLNYNKKSHLG